MRCQSLLLCLHNCTHLQPTTRTFFKRSTVSWITSISVLSVALTWAPPAHTFSTYRRLPLFVFLGKTTHGSSAAAGLAIVSYACWAPCFSLERAAKEGPCAPLEVGSFAVICKQDSRIEADYFFCCFALTIFCFLCFNQTAYASASCRTARLRPISPILSKTAKCTFHIQTRVF